MKIIGDLSDAMDREPPAGRVILCESGVRLHLAVNDLAALISLFPHQSGVSEAGDDIAKFVAYGSKDIVARILVQRYGIG
jgi:hypothetical protein